ncbi:YdcF family protein [Halobacteria archaeon AArc-curdl1]|uniref:YdcF family protein n=1 Tax=Natronosalvus hydrolyticus TaxID=2979988 RepID=A0AAP2Z627_9EURY|nr:YdcF family protein [Halobacteria archaeon AArc-curdl1]
MVIVTLGCRTRTPLEVTHLRGRVDVSIETFRENDAPCLLFTGGVTHPAARQPECVLMKNYAVRSGTSPDRIILENRALDTIGNGYFSRLLVENLPRTTDRVTLVTSDYHLERATYIFEQCYGPDYDMLPIPYSGTPLETAGQETRSLRQAKSFFDGITPGDIESIGERLIENHDYYDHGRTVSLPIEGA